MSDDRYCSVVSEASPEIQNQMTITNDIFLISLKYCECTAPKLNLPNNYPCIASFFIADIKYLAKI